MHSFHLVGKRSWQIWIEIEPRQSFNFTNLHLVNPKIFTWRCAIWDHKASHGNADSILPIVKKTLKKDYVEQLADGLYVFHYPFAKNPLDRHVLHHSRIAQFVPGDDGSFEIIAPYDFLTVRFLHSIKE